MNRKRILFYVQHLLGSGHLHRTVQIAEAVVNRGAEAIIVSGGMPLKQLSSSDLELIQLEPIRSDGTDFSNIIDQYGFPVTDQIFSNRKRQLLEVQTQFQPDVVVVESWPFGRGVVNDELEWFLDDVKKNKPDVKLTVSIRDILQLRSEKKQRKTLHRLSRYFDSVMVHGDANIVTLDESFSLSHELTIPVVYTGYIAPAPEPRSIDVSDIVVSAGGGLAGASFYQLVMQVALDDPDKNVWRFMAGGDKQIHGKLWENLPSRIIVENNRPDFLNLLSQSALLVSQCGYNTMMDILVTGIPAIVIPFEGIAETEQLKRAEVFSNLDSCILCRELDGTKRLAELVKYALGDREDYIPWVKLDGAFQSAYYLTQSL